MKEKLYIIDAYNLIYRMFYAIPEFRRSDGLPVNAIFGVTKMILNFIENEHPDHLVIACDGPGKTFRDEMYEEYKGTRDRMPDDLRSQTEYIFEFLKAANISTLTVTWYEADDIMGALAKKYAPEYEVVIISADKDIFQCITDSVFIYDPIKRIRYNKEKSFEKYGIHTHQIPDYLAIIGDNSDNIPGVKWVGPKGAVKLLTEYKTLEGIYENIENISGKTQQYLIENKEIAFFSKKLVTIDADMPLGNFLIKDAKISSEIYTNALIDFLKKMEFGSLIPKNKKQEEKIKIKETYVLEKMKLKTLWEEIKISGKITLNIEQKNGKLEKVFFCFDQPEVYILDIKLLDCKEFFYTLLQSNVTLHGYNIKTILRYIMMYLKHEKQEGIF